MKVKFLILVTLFISIVGCKKEDHTIEPVFEGDYVGTFERNGRTSKVEFTFQDGKYEGESEIDKFPAICDGTYTTIKDDKITFINPCAWTAEFDWTLILDGTWEFTVDGDEIVLTKADDTYTLTKQ